MDLTTLAVTKLPLPPGKPARFAARKFIGVQEGPSLFLLYEVTAAGATLIARLPIEPKNEFAYCEEKRLLAWTGDSETILLTSLEQPTGQVALPSQAEGAVPVRFSTDGRFLLATDRQRVAQVWDVTGQRRLAAAEQYFSPFGLPVSGKSANATRGNHLLRWIASSTSPGVASGDSAQIGTTPAGLWPDGAFGDRAFSPDGRLFAISSDLGTTTLYDIN
jgi:hypothetical protein